MARIGENSKRFFTWSGGADWLCRADVDRDFLPLGDQHPDLAGIRLGQTARPTQARAYQGTKVALAGRIGRKPRCAGRALDLPAQIPKRAVLALAIWMVQRSGPYGLRDCLEGFQGFVLNRVGQG